MHDTTDPPDFTITFTAAELNEAIDCVRYTIDECGGDEDIVALLARLRSMRGDAILCDPPRCAACEAPLDLDFQPRLSTCPACNAVLNEEYARSEKAEADAAADAHRYLASLPARPEVQR